MVKTLAGFGLAFQLPLDRNRIMASGEDRSRCVETTDPPACSLTEPPGRGAPICADALALPPDDSRAGSSLTGAGINKVPGSTMPGGTDPDQQGQCRIKYVSLSEIFTHSLPRILLAR